MKKPTGKGWVLMGHVSVDSGSLLVGDPCYLPFKENEGTGQEPVLDTVTNKLYQYVYSASQLVEGAEAMTDGWDSFIPGTTITFNKGRDSGRLVIIPHPVDKSFSRAGCQWAHCDSKERFAELGSCGEAIVFASGYGDGSYEVWGRKNAEGRIVEVRILMD
jgi:hypothetical protein